MTRLMVCLLLAAGFPAFLNAQEKSTDTNPPSPASGPLEPKVAPASSEGQDAIATFTVPPGWRCELFASEPDVANPVALYVDYANRVFVCESYRQNQGVTDNRGHNNQWLRADLAAKTVQDRIDYHRKLLDDRGASYQLQDDRIRLLVDQDQNGVADRSSVFANGFHQLEDGTGAGVLVRGNSAYYTCIPRLWKLTDRDGDGIAEERTSLAEGFGVRVAFRGHDMHGLVIGPDGRLYFSIGDRGYHVQTSDGLLADPASGAVFRCELDGSHLEVFATGLRNPQELAFDDYGRLFTGDNNSDSGDKARWVYVVEGGDTGWRMYYQYLPDRGPFNREKIWHPYSSSTPAYIVPPIANLADGPSGLTFYPGTGFGDSLNDTFLLCDFRGQPSNSGIRKLKLKPKGAFFEVEQNEQLVWQMLATDADFGPDGSLYVSDWVNGWNGEGKGRVYRLFDPARKTSADVKSTREILSEPFTNKNLEQLKEHLQHPDRRVRWEAQWELASRDAWQILAEAASRIESPVKHRLHGIWGLGQIARKSSGSRAKVETVLSRLGSSTEPELVAALLEMIGDAYRGSTSSPHAGWVVSKIDDSEPIVRYAASIAAGKMRLGEAMPKVVGMLERNRDEDPILRHGGIMALAGQKDLSPVIALKDHASSSVRLAAVVALRKRQEPQVALFLSDRDNKVVTEAARAIHDVTSLHSQLGVLANQKPLASHPQAFLHRYLNANFRLGSARHAAAVAALAANSQHDEELRLEAIKMLTLWAQPDSLDRVLNDHRPLEERGPSIARDALGRHLKELARTPNAIRTAALTAATRLGLSDVEPLLEQVVLDKNAPGTDRASALADLVKLQGKTSLALTTKMSVDHSPAVRIAAMQALESLDPNAALASVRRAIASGVSIERQAGWDSLKGIRSAEADEVIEQGIRSYLSASLSADCRLNILDVAKGRLNTELQAALDSFQKVREELATANPSVLYEDCLEGGDMFAGRTLFFERSQLSCVRCHKVKDQGGEVGPPLTDLGAKKDAQYLLEAIVAPNLKIAEGFETVILATDEGQVHSGIIKTQNEKEIVLIKPDATTVTVDKESIVGRNQGQSSMPSDLMKYLNQKELRDLMSYLKSLDGKNPHALPKSSGGGHAEK